jgi:hypothetical protein
MECPDATLNPFAEWPWEQGLRVTPDLPYKRAGRLLRNALCWCNKFCTCPIMKMTYDLALLIASQAMAEATEQMQCILVNAQARAATYPGPAFLVHVAGRRQTQAAELKIFLAEISSRVTEASKAQAATTGGATAAWVDFLSGWPSRADTDLVEQDSIHKVTQAALTSLPPASARAASTPPRATPSDSCSQRTPKASPAGTPGGSGSDGVKGGSGLGSGGSGCSGGGSSSVLSSAPVWSICRFKKNIPCSVDIVGESLGVSGAPPYTFCNNGAHYHGECPLKWGGIGTALPGFALDGQRNAADWKGNEPIRRVVKQWVTFLKDTSNFNKKIPSPAEAAGAPGLSEFKARVSSAPKKP